MKTLTIRLQVLLLLVAGAFPASIHCCHGQDFASRMEAMAKKMEESGVVYAIIGTDFYQGVTSGGVDENFENGVKIDQFLMLDTTKMGLWEGMTVVIHAESRLGDDVNFDAVGFSPVNVAMLYPKSNEHDTAITGFQFAQALSEEVQFTFGKFNALDLFYMLYPQTGRGVSGFMNASMVIPLSIARVAPLSFMGTGMLKLSGKQIQGGILAYDTNSVPTTSGFDNMFDNGANIMGFWRFFTDFGGLPGSHMFGGVWSTGAFTALDPTGWEFIPGQGIVAPQETGAYTLLYIAEQTLWFDDYDKDRKVTLLSQNGYSDEQTSPYSWSTNVAIQSTGLVSNRPKDAIGIGAFYTGISDDLQNLLSPLIDVQDVYGAELYYNMEIAKCFHVTGDLQFVEPGNSANDTAVVVGLRATLAL
ncbi:carbohydrate porin [Bythopirellula polymerisocia]|uniref:Carbohydrate-selective porin, OprB family n=1 Tax=Bythopirellula polymerisocia TaxID=2528003 RepID=A0A5C6D1G8_9BACT|nr:carbohydrate porin [Bythopirellula polymerisocia]TWU29591.1 Carbohydrate-selective porin, OprB family [Bythopirellula polymerisocia]